MDKQKLVYRKPKLHPFKEDNIKMVCTDGSAATGEMAERSVSGIVCVPGTSADIQYDVDQCGNGIADGRPGYCYPVAADCSFGPGIYYTAISNCIQGDSPSNCIQGDSPTH